MPCAAIDCPLHIRGHLVQSHSEKHVQRISVKLAGNLEDLLVSRFLLEMYLDFLFSFHFTVNNTDSDMSGIASMALILQNEVNVRMLGRSEGHVTSNV